jgi:sugar phosphate isomerase/epimerase
MPLINRRGFLRRSAVGLSAFAASAGLPKFLLGNPYGLPVGLQVYTVRDQLAKDVTGTLKKVAQVGFKEVEVDGFFGKTPAGFRSLMQETHLSAPAAHYGFGDLTSGWGKHIEFAKAVGLKYMVVSALEEEYRTSLDGFKKAAEAFNKAGEQTRKAGIQFGYHNHNFEFNKFGGTLAYDVLVKETDPRLVHFELDCFWMIHGGHDPVHYFETYPGRFPLLHIKDLKKGIPASTSFKNPYGNPFTEVGRGVIDWKQIFKAAKRGGLKHYFVEQDQCDIPPFEAIKISYDYLRNLTV